MNYLKRHEVGFFTKDVEMLVIRFDNNRDGRVSYVEVKFLIKFLVFR